MLVFDLNFIFMNMGQQIYVVKSQLAAGFKNLYHKLLSAKQIKSTCGTK